MILGRQRRRSRHEPRIDDLVGDLACEGKALIEGYEAGIAMDHDEIEELLDERQRLLGASRFAVLLEDVANGAYDQRAWIHRKRRVEHWQELEAHLASSK